MVGSQARTLRLKDAETVEIEAVGLIYGSSGRPVAGNLPRTRRLL